MDNGGFKFEESNTGNVESCEGLVASDDVKGGKLIPSKVKAARGREMRFVKERKIYEYYQKKMDSDLGSEDPPLVGVRWVDTNKGDAQDPNYRRRLVAQEFRKSHMESIFAGTPPLEAFRLLLAMAVQQDPRNV